MRHIRARFSIRLVIYCYGHWRPQAGITLLAAASVGCSGWGFCRAGGSGQAMSEGAGLSESLCWDFAWFLGTGRETEESV